MQCKSEIHSGKNKMKPKEATLSSLSWPVVVELLVTGLINTASQYILNAFSTDAMAVVGSLSQVVSLIINLYTLVSVGGSILLMPLVGAGKTQDCNKIIQVLLRANLILGVIVSIVSLCGMESFMHLMQISEELYPLGRQYLIISLALSFVQSLLITYTAIFRSYGKMKAVLICNIMVYLVCFLVNVGIRYGIPKTSQSLIYYTLAGIIGQGSGVLYLHIRLIRDIWKKNSPQKLGKGDFNRYLKKILVYGIPGGMEGILYLVSQMLVVSMIGILGTKALLIKSYVGNFGGYMVLCTSGINTAVFVLIGQLYGKNDFVRIRKVFRQGNLQGLLLTFGIGITILLFENPLIKLFTVNPEITVCVKQLLLIQLIIELLRVPIALIVSSLKSLGDVNFLFPLVISGAITNLSVSYLCGITMRLGLLGIWMGYGADLILRGIIGYLRLRRQMNENASIRRI